MKRTIAAILSAAMLVTAAAAAEAPSSWAKSAVDTARNAGIVPEQVDQAYTQSITRADFCALAAAVYRTWEKSGNVKSVDKATVSFSDTKDEDVLLCASLGVVNGVGNGKFAPQQQLTRQQAASMLHRLGNLRRNAKDSVKERMPHVFADGADIQAWARSDVYWAYNSGVMNGVSGNRFAPNNSYTHEQSIATMLRLYDTKYAEVPSGETAAEYAVVMDDEGGAGARSQMHIENAKGKKLLTDYKDTKGTFENVTLLGVWAGVTMENGTKYDVVNLKTGEKLEDYRILVADGEQAGWLCPMDITKVTYGKDYIALADGTKSTATYDRMTNFKDGKAVVNVDGKTIRAFDTTGKTLWSMNFAFDHSKAAVDDGEGDRFVVTNSTSTSYTIIAGGKRIASSSLPLKVSQYSDTYIHMESVGYYALYNFNGKKLTKTYQNAFDEVGQNIYSHWINDKEYEYIRCDADGTNKVLFRVKCPNGRPGALPTDGAGVYALRTDEHTVTCFDCFGTTLGTIKQDGEITMEPTFENGCVRVMDKLYLPTGEEI
ncbi:S-layer homology domain-containing protein [Agathobaculum butyriciproducens]|uniref:S-layer homology domain-containing protein n=1 Tax=Agathobaculum butyriciproducens TaxID=1628085 RepID=A0AAW4VZG0_9FIRM|nr:S-layer homology domain-containing protein [Agathobaculum butyriciproducens]